MNTESIIYAAYAKSGKGYEIIGDECHLSTSQVGRIFSEDNGILISKLGAFLNALGLKIVPADSTTIRKDHLNALLLASEELNRIIRARMEKGLPVGEGE